MLENVVYPFFHIMHVVAHDPYFQQKHDACGILGLFPIQKFIVMLKMLAYNVVVDTCDEYCKLGKSTSMEAWKKFCNVVKECFKTKYF
jgi:hypothetical protein